MPIVTCRKPQTCSQCDEPIKLGRPMITNPGLEGWEHLHPECEEELE